MARSVLNLQCRSTRSIGPFTLLIGVVMLAAALIFPSGWVGAAPSQRMQAPVVSTQFPSWMSAETASRLNIGIDVFAPSYVAAPFSGEPEVQAYDGYYSFYWFIPGAPPTFLRVTGEYGGFIPDFSYYDRNVQLEVNADVLGYPAYRDITPIYDVVYWRVGEVVYTVESHNLAADNSLGIANSLSYVNPPEPPAIEEPEFETPPESEPTPTAEQPSGPVVRTLGVPANVQSGETANIGVDADGDYLLVADDGYFTATGENSVVVGGSAALDWMAPYYESDQVIGFYAYNLETGDLLNSGQTNLEGYLSVGESLVADIQCPAEASAGKQARVLISGSGTMVINATDGSWPAESPNLGFQPDADGGLSLVGTLAEGDSAALSWLAPSTPTTAFISVTDLEGTLIDECGVVVGDTSDAGDLGGPSAGLERVVSGDGTGIDDVEPGVVLRAIANPTGFAGDASGGPEANGPDYGYRVPGEVANSEDESAETGGLSAAAIAVAETNAAEDEELGPVSGDDGLIAQTMGPQGGRLENPLGAQLSVPQGALKDQATVMLKPVPEEALPSVATVRFIEGTAFDVGFSASDGQAVEAIELPAALTLALNAAPSNETARIYRIDGNSIKPMPVVAEDAGSVTTDITEMSRYVIGVPAPVVAGTTRSVNPILIGGLGIVALISAGLLMSRGLQRRRTRIVPVRRPAAQARVRYR